MPAPRTRKLPIVALVGRANVGKSTLWNRLTESTAAMVSDVPHTTRDRRYGHTLWRGAEIEVVDTGGLDASSGEEIGRGMQRQTRHAIKDADLVLMLVDSKSRMMPQDVEIAAELKKLKKPTLLVANKTDTTAVYAQAFGRDVYRLGLGEPIPCSASTGRNVGDLLDLVYERLKQLDKLPDTADAKIGLRMVIMGRPNVGKSSIVNALLGEERVITSAVPHTTREPIDTYLEWKGQPVILVDTAGMRRRSRVERGIEKDSLERNREALRRADVAVLVVDANEDPKAQDKHLAGLLMDEYKGLIIAVNKWDLAENKTQRSTQEAEVILRQLFPFLAWAPIIFVSAKNHQRTDKLLDMAFTIRDERRREIAYNALQKLLKQVIAKKHPLAEGANFAPYIHDVKQIGIEPPTFIIQVRGNKAEVHPSWVRYFENSLRKKFGFVGTPIKVNLDYSAMPTVAEQEEQLGGKRQKARRKRPIGRKGGRY